MLLPFAIGIVLSAGVGLFARYVGFDRDRAFDPTVMIVIASYYVLFAAMSGSVQTVVIESVVMTLFAAAAVAGFKSSTWIVVVALAGLVSRVRRRCSGHPCLAHQTPTARSSAVTTVTLARVGWWRSHAILPPFLAQYTDLERRPHVVGRRKHPSNHDRVWRFHDDDDLRSARA